MAAYMLTQKEKKYFKSEKKRAIADAIGAMTRQVDENTDDSPAREAQGLYKIYRRGGLSAESILRTIVVSQRQAEILRGVSDLHIMRRQMIRGEFLKLIQNRISERRRKLGRQRRLRRGSR
jgi:hypothetical protein